MVRGVVSRADEVDAIHDGRTFNNGCPRPLSLALRQCSCLASMNLISPPAPCSTSTASTSNSSWPWPFVSFFLEIAKSGCVCPSPIEPDPVRRCATQNSAGCTTSFAHRSDIPADDRENRSHSLIFRSSTKHRVRRRHLRFLLFACTARRTISHTLASTEKSPASTIAPPRSQPSFRVACQSS